MFFVNFELVYSAVSACLILQLAEELWTALRVKRVVIRSFFLLVFSCIWTEEGNLRSKSPYPARMWENADQKNSKYGHFSHILVSSSSVESSKFEVSYCVFP